MSILNRMILGVAVAGALIGPAAAAQVCYFGECAGVPSAAAHPVPPKAPDCSAESVILATYGSWSVKTWGNCQRMAVDTFDDGSKLAIAKVHGQVVFALADQDWALTQGQTFEVKVDIDGDVFTGTAEAIDSTKIAISNVSANVMKAMYHGQKAIITIGHDKWYLTLPDAAKAIEAAGDLVKA